MKNGEITHPSILNELELHNNRWDSKIFSSGDHLTTAKDIEDINEVIDLVWLHHGTPKT